MAKKKVSEEASEIGRRLASLRSEKLSPARRKEIAQKAVNTRWQRKRDEELTAKKAAEV